MEIKKFNEYRSDGFSKTGTEMNSIIRSFSNLDILEYAESGDGYEITQEDVINCPNLKDFLGWVIRLDVDGDHRHDGQMVDYTFTFVSPNSKETEIYTEMCLMVGWNLPRNENYWFNN